MKEMNLPKIDFYCFFDKTNGRLAKDGKKLVKIDFSNLIWFLWLCYVFFFIASPMAPTARKAISLVFRFFFLSFFYSSVCLCVFVISPLSICGGAMICWILPTLKNNKHAKGIFIEFLGKAYCHWTEGSGNKKETHTGTETYLEERIYFVGQRTGKYTLPLLFYSFPLDSFLCFFYFHAVFMCVLCDCQSISHYYYYNNNKKTIDEINRIMCIVFILLMFFCFTFIHLTTCPICYFVFLLFFFYFYCPSILTFSGKRVSVNSGTNWCRNIFLSLFCCCVGKIENLYRKC